MKMLKISCAEMKAIDTFAIEELEIPSILLMENAALKVIKNIDLKYAHSFTIICAPGNNGGDGLAIARHLLVKDKKVDLFIIGDLSKATTDFQTNLTILNNMQTDFTQLTEINDLPSLTKSLKKNDITIDAIFGIGLDRPVEGIFAQAIEQINKHAHTIIAVDIPSGLNGDSGEVLGIAVHAHKTICFHLMKKGLFHRQHYTGEVIIEGIGIPNIATQTILTHWKNL